MRILGLILLVFTVVGCRTSTVVHRPYSAVHAALVTMEHQIDAKMRAFTDAEAAGPKRIFTGAEATGHEVQSGRCYELYINEFVNSKMGPYTIVRATASSGDSTSVTVSSKKKDGLILDSRQPEIEKRRLAELLEILR
jgi:hypothetical protein